MDAMKRFCWIICAVVVTMAKTAAVADTGDPMAMSAAQGMAVDRTDEMPYVIKVTSSLVYLDIGTAMGAEPGQLYLIVRFTDDGSHVWVGEAKVIRTFLDFSIAEIVSTVEGEGIEILQRAISMEQWQTMAEMSPQPGGATSATGSRFLYVFFGRDWNKGVDLARIPGGDVAAGFDRISEPGLGLRLGNFLDNNWRLNLTYRVSGRPVSSGDGDVTHLSLEVDVHYLFSGRGQVGPYVGVGVGGHRLSWTAARPLPDSASKLGVNLVAGIELPFSRDRWSFLVEGGYQWVDEWGTDRINVSNVRTYAGLGRNF